MLKMISSWEVSLIILGNLAGGYFLVTKLLRGSGRLLGVVLAIILGGLAWVYPAAGTVALVLLSSALVGVVILEHSQKKDVAHSQLIFEGGGIRRGLTPVEVGTLLEVSPGDLLVVSVSALLQKGILERVDQGLVGLRVKPLFQTGRDVINPAERTAARKKAARDHSKVLSVEEELLLELFWQHIPPSSEKFPIQLWVEKAIQECNLKLGGYDRSQSKVYYHNYMAHRFEGVEKGFFQRDEYVPWMVLDIFAHTQDEAFLLDMIEKTRPAWLHEGESLIDWAESFQKLLIGKGN